MGRFNCCLVAVVVALGVGLGPLMESDGAPTETDAGEEWSAWRNVRQGGGGRGSSSLNSILSQSGLNAGSRQKLLQGLSTRDGDQLASDLTQLIRTLNEPRYAGLREQVRSAISRPMSREVALDVLSRLNMPFRELAWWKRINMLSVNKVW